MIRPPRPGKNLTVDYRSALSGAQAGKGQSKEGSYLGGLTASQYAELFPDYFRRARPDIGISASGRLPGRQLPSAAALPGVGQPATAAGRAAQRAQSGAPGTQPSGPSGPGSPKTAVPPGWTPTDTSRAGNLPRRSKDGMTDDKLTAMMRVVASGETGRMDFSKSDQISPDTGGSRSYGVLGVNSGSGSAAQFAKRFPELGLRGRPGSAEFDASWRAAAARDPKVIIDAQKTFFVEEYVNPSLEGLKKAGVPESVRNDPRVQAYFADRAIQQGKNSISRDAAHIAKAWQDSGGDVPKFFRNFNDNERAHLGTRFKRAIASGVYGVRGNETRLKRRTEGALGMGTNEEYERKSDKKEDESDGEYLPKLETATKEMLAEAGAPPKTATPASGRKSPIGFGDSMMVATLNAHKHIERGFAKDGAGPKEIFAQMQEWEKNNPGGLSGRDLHLSTGLLNLNSTGDVETVRAMVEWAKSKGANITLFGGPQGQGTRKDLVDVHKKLEMIGAETGVKVGPSYVPVDGIHAGPDQFAAGLGVVQPPKEATAYPKVEGLPSAPNIKGMKAEQLGETFPEGSQRFFHEGGGRNIDPRLVEVMKEASKDLPPGYHVRMFSGRDARATGTKNHPGGVAVDLAIVDDQGRRLNDRGFGHGHKIYEQLAHSMNERGKVMYPGTSYLWGGSWNAGVGGDRMHYQIHDPKNPVSGASSSMTQYDWNTGVHRNHWAGVPDAWMTKDELNEYKTRIREKILQEQRAAAEEVQKEQATATPVRTIRAEDGQTKKLMFDTGRAYTESDVKTMMARYGKDLVIGANLDTPEEYEKVRALAEKYGLGIHGYSKGRGAPQSGWGNQFPREQKEVQRLARERGISLNQWYNGGWMDYEIDRLKKLGVKAPHQIELDNANDAKDGNAFEQELLKYAQAGLNTRIVPKNWGEREYAAYHKLVEQKKIPADIVVPLNITETKHIQGTEGVTKKAGHSFGAMPADNIGRYATTEPLQQPPPVQTEPVKQNAYGGVAQAYNSKEDVMFAQAGKGIIGGVAPGETIRYDKDGQITVVPGHRSDANALSDRSGKEADARVHAMTTIADANEHGSAMAMVPTPPQPSPQVGQSNVRTIDNPPSSPSHDRAMAKIKVDDNHGGYALQTSRIFTVV